MKKNFILVLAMMVIPTIIFSQIMYNVSKPFSYDKSGLKNISELPQIHFPVNNNGNLIEQNLKLNIKEKAVNEIIDNKFVSRMKVKVFAKKLGMMTLILDNVKLNNNSYCYVYTPDYKIVAGPVYQGSIDKYLIIKEIPTDELIIEVISDFASDFDLSIDEVDYLSIYKSKKNDSKKSEKLQSGGDSCHTCNNGEKSYSNFIDETQECGWLGYGDNGELFNQLNFKGINGYNYNASRSACVIMTPDCSVLKSHFGNNGNLIHFPYQNCDSNEDCNNAFVISVAHHWELEKIYLAEINKDFDYLTKVLFRFNWHHEYGTPWNLENIDCSANQANFEKWRSSINFDEVIDYCGANVFGYSLPAKGDFIILKIKQKLFYKEHHLGWSEQRYFNYEGPSAPNPFSLMDSSRFKIIGRRVSKPTMLINNYYCGYQWDPKKRDYYDTVNRLSFVVFKRNQKNNTDIIKPLDYIGYSGSQLTYNDYIDSNQRIGIGLVREGAIGFDLGFIHCRTYYNMFNLWEGVEILDSCFSNNNKIMDYIANNFANIVQTKQYSYRISKDSYDTTCKWMPSLDNKQKCPSQIAVQDPCSFNINNFISIDSLCVAIDSIPSNLFPDDQFPKGYRIYHNFGEQKTIKFDEFNDNYNGDITFPIEFCIDKCYMLYLMSIGKDNMDIAIDFYDSNGRILNNLGCDTLHFIIPFSQNYCDMFTMSLNKSASNDTCCNVSVSLSLDDCFKNSASLNKTIDDFYLEVPNLSSKIAINDMNNFSINYQDAIISFDYEICNAQKDSFFVFKTFFRDTSIVCKTDSIQIYPCSCDCPSDSIMYSWFEITVGEYDTGCEEGCSVNATLNIPPTYDCYNRYSIKPWSFKLQIQPGTNLFGYNSSNLGCIGQGEFRFDTLRLYKDVDDSNYCEIIKPVYCPIEGAYEGCSVDCDTVAWTHEEINEPLTNCPGCRVHAEFLWRRNSCNVPILQEIQIVKMEIYNEIDGSNSCEGCGMDQKDIYAYALKKAIMINKMGFFPINEGDCYDSWRVLNASCWIEYETNSGGLLPFRKKVYKPCDSVSCCSVGIRVCRYQGPPVFLTFESLDDVNGGDSCLYYYEIVADTSQFGVPHINPDMTITYFYPDTIQCQDKCNWLDAIDDNEFFGKRTYPNYDIESQLKYGLNRINVKIKVLEDYLDCFVESDYESNNLKFNIYSIEGRSILSTHNDLYKGENNYQIPISNLKSGIYILNLTIDSNILDIKKFILVK